MDHIIEQMLKQYNTQTIIDKKNGIKEVVQEIILCGLSRAGFFKTAAFYGGTALRIFYGLDRFSEDLDFSSMSSDPFFDLSEYFPILEKEVHAYGLNFKVEAKEKTFESVIKSAFLKGNTKEHMLMFYADEQLTRSIGLNELIKVKFELDTNPPEKAAFETRFRLLPMPYEVTLYDMPSLFAGKIHTVLCSAWKSRVKGRDLYDYVFFVARQSTVNLVHLTARLIQSGFLPNGTKVTLADLKAMLCKRFAEIDFTQAKQDFLPFIRNPGALDVWSTEFFCQITDGLVIDEPFIY